MNAVLWGWADVRGANGRNGAGKRNRTSDLLITNQLLYRLSYSGVGTRILDSGQGNGNRRSGRRIG
jgi:hypothetical protein